MKALKQAMEDGFPEALVMIGHGVTNQTCYKLSW